MIKYGIHETEEVCANCKHFYQHYVKVGLEFDVCNAGHCSYPRAKDKKPNDWCKNFESRYVPEEERRTK